MWRRNSCHLCRRTIRDCLSAYKKPDEDWPARHYRSRTQTLFKAVICFKSLSAVSSLVFALLTSMVTSSTVEPCLLNVRNGKNIIRRSLLTSFRAPARLAGPISRGVQQSLSCEGSEHARSTLPPFVSSSIYRYNKPSKLERIWGNTHYELLLENFHRVFYNLYTLLLFSEFIFKMLLFALCSQTIFCGVLYFRLWGTCISDFLNQREKAGLHQ